MNSISELLQRELATVEHTRNRLSGANTYMHEIFDAMLKISEVANQLEDQQDFTFYAWTVVIEAPADARSAFILYERGYYLQANILIRTLLEKAIVLRYVIDDKSRAVDALLPNKRIIKSDAFKATSPNLYKSYGVLSGMVHGDVTAILPRWVDHQSREKGIRQAATWSEFSASYSLNLLTQILSIHLKLYRHIYAKVIADHAPHLAAILNNAIAHVTSAEDAHKRERNRPGTDAHYEAINAVTDGL